MNAVVFGAGRIGCGFVGHLLRSAGHGVTFVTRNPAVVGNLNRLRCYVVCLMSATKASHQEVGGVRAVWVGHREEVQRQLERADLVAVAVGVPSLPAVARLLAQGLRGRRDPINVLVFENLRDAGRRVRRLVVDHGSPAAEHGFASVLVERVVSRRLGDPDGDLPLTFLGDQAATFAVDGRDLRAPLPRLQGMVVTDQYDACIRRKLSIFSAGHATTAYLGHLAGCRTIQQSLGLAAIRSAVLGAMAEGQAGLVVRYGPDFAGGEAELRATLERLENPALDDTVARVGREPRRKLAPEDRLVGSALLAEQAGVAARHLAGAIAAALRFRHDDDADSLALQAQLHEHGLNAVLRKVCGLEPGRPLVEAVADDWHRLVVPPVAPSLADISRG